MICSIAAVISTRRLAAGVCSLLAMATMVTMGGAPAAAADGEGAAEPPKVELVLDVSGSMRAADIGGMTRIAAAKQAFGEVVDALPDEVQLGIRTLGATYPGEDKGLGCKDSAVLVPVGPINKVEAKTAVATLAPTGWTPVGYALRGAADDLGAGTTTRRIVLITDGEDTCGLPDPCDVARELAAQGTHLVVDTLGLTLDAKVRDQLTCIAEATGGTYTAVQTEQQLSGRLNQLVQRQADTYETAPTIIAGKDSCADAPVLSAGVYTDREQFEEHRWYRVPVEPGHELRASVSVGVDRTVNRDYSVTVRAVTPGGQELARHTDAGSGRTDVVSAGLRYPVANVDEDADDTAKTVCLVVSNAFSAPASVKRTPGLPVELSIDVVNGSDAPGDVHGLGRGWVLIVVLVGVGLVTGLVAGWLSRLRVAPGRES